MTDVSLPRHPLRLFTALCLISFPLAACSSASGDGDDHSPRDHKVIVVPRGTDVVCPDGNHPPCP